MWLAVIDSILTLSELAGSAGCGCAFGWWLRNVRSRPGKPSGIKASEACREPRSACADAIRDAEGVKAALETVRSDSMRRRHHSTNGIAPTYELRRVLSEVLTEIANSPIARDAEAGRLLLDYYIKRVGSHEVVMERLYLSRATFYRRRKYGLNLVAQLLDEKAA